MLKKYFILFISFLFLFSCSNPKKSLTDTIQFINVSAGVEKSIPISDIFYSEIYNFSFQGTENTKVSFDGNNLIIKTAENFQGVDLITVSSPDSEDFVIPIRSKTKHKAIFSFKPEKKYGYVRLIGEFNSWNRENIEMKDENNDGIYETEIQLDPGKYQYKFYCDGSELIDPENPNVVPNGLGGVNNIYEANEITNDKVFLHKLDFDKSNNAFKFLYTKNSNSTKPPLKSVFALIDNSFISEEYIKFKDNEIILSIPEYLTNKNLLRVIVSENNNMSNIQYVNLVGGIPSTGSNFESWYDASIYSLLTDRFYDGDSTNNNPIPEREGLSEKANYQGGDFAGIIKKIKEGYFNELGVNTLWISPANDNPNIAYPAITNPNRYFTGYHGYWPIDGYRVEEHFGNLSLLKELVNTAHENGLKVLLDFVSNHVHIEHPYWKEHRDWFGQLDLPDGRKNIRFWDEFRLTTWFEPYMPSFDYIGSKEALDTMTSNAVWWLNTTGADGYRHDAVKHVPNEFWRELTRKIKAEVALNRKLPVYQIGETFGGMDLISSYVNNGQLSSQFNFNLYDAAQATFIVPSTSFTYLDEVMKKTFETYGDIHLMGNIMDSHDKNRYMAYADGDLDISQWSAEEEGWNNPPKVDNPENYNKAIIYLAYMYSVPGIPVLYYGSEFGMTGASDPDNRRKMRFGEYLDEYEKEMLQITKKIVNIRNENSAFRYGDFFTVASDENIYAYIRSDFNQRILVVINKNETQNFDLNIQIPKEYRIKTAVDLINSENLAISSEGIVLVSINKESFRYFLLN